MKEKEAVGAYCPSAGPIAAGLPEFCNLYAALQPEVHVATLAVAYLMQPIQHFNDETLGVLSSRRSLVHQ